MFARLSRKAKQREKDKRACDKRPAEHLQFHSHLRVILPSDAWDLRDHRIVSMRVGPALPRVETLLSIGHNKKRRYRNGRKYIGGRYDHQAEIPALTETRGR